jgi:PAS domain S-box-containing protein
VFGIARDITQCVQAEKLIYRKNQIQSVINEILNLSLESRSLEEILECALEKIVSIDWLKLKSQGAIFLVGENPDELVLKVSREFSEELKNICFKIHIGKCLCGLAASRKEVMFANYLDDCHESRYVGMAPHAHYCVPIQSSGTILGVLNLYVEVDHQHNKDKENTLLAMANVLAGIIKRKQGEKELDKHRQHLEELVKERTIELTQKNNQLKEEITERKRVKEALVKEKEFTENALNAQTDTFFVFNPMDGKPLRWNKIFNEVSGYSDEEIRSMTPRDFYKGEDLKRLAEATRKVVHEGKVNVEFSLVTKSGKCIPYEYSGVLIKDPETNIDYVCAIGRDITERKQIEDKLLKERNFSETAINSLPGIFYLVDEKGRILRHNENFEVITGYSGKEISKLTAFDFVSKKDRENIAERMQEVLEKGKAPLEADLLTKNGKKIPYFFTGSRMIVGNKKYIVGMGIDLTERKRVESELLKQQYFLTKAQEIGKIGTWELDIKKNLLVWTDETYRIFELPIGTELTYETFLDCVHPDDREYVDKEWKAAFNKKPYDIEHRLLMSDGSIKWVREKAQLEFDEQGNCLRGTGFAQDITQQKLAEEEINVRQKEIEEINANLEERVQEELEKSREKDFLMVHQSRLAAMGEMIGYIAHQWKQPLNALNILLFNIKDGLDEPELDKETLYTIIPTGEKLIDKMSKTIDDFRSFFKPDRQKEPFSINKNIKNIISIVVP